MKKIARFNGTYDLVDWTEFSFDAPMYNLKHSKSKDVWNRSKTKQNRYSMIFIQFGIMVIFYTLTFMIKYLHGSVFDHIKFSAMADFFGIFSMGFIYNWLGVKKTLYCYLVALLFTIPAQYYIVIEYGVFLFINKLITYGICSSLYVINV